MMDDYKNSDNFQGGAGCKMISPHHSHPTNGVRPSDSDVYGYNIRNELVSSTKNAEGTEYQYQYDDIGNRITSLDLGTNRTYTANNLNQYTSISNSAASALSAGEFVPQFDDDGNQTLIQTATGIWQVTYNGENRPIFWFNGVTNIVMQFDRMGRRVTKNNQRFVYDGYLQIANFEHQTSNIKLQTFIWDPAEPIATRPLVWNYAPSSAYYAHDGNKNVSEVVAENCDIAAHYEYAPFGVVTSHCGASAQSNPWRFSCEFIDSETELLYYNYRNFDLSLGRWNVREPLNETATQLLFDGFRGVVYRVGALEYAAYMNNPQVFYDVVGLFLPGGISEWGGLYTGSMDRGNCWRYACNDKCNPANREIPCAFPPGRLPQTNPEEAPFTCDSIKNAVLRKYSQDGVSVVAKSQSCGKCSYKVLLVIRPRTLYGPYAILAPVDNFTAEWDYHFYRQDTDSNCKPTGSWSHKPGVGPVVHGVVDPESDASIRLYSMHCPFYFCLPCKRNENEEAIDVDRK